jgi:DNA-binding NtrC family response regulator
MQRFMDYAWRGNVRELENIIKRIVALGNEDWIAAELTNRRAEPMLLEAPAPLIPPPVAPLPPATAVAAAVPTAAAPASRWDESLGLREIARRASREAEQAALKEVLDRVRWHRVEAARRLKISYKTLLRKMQECGLGN